MLVVDIGGTNVKILATGQKTFRKVPSGRELTPQKMVSEVARLAGDWEYRRRRDRLPGAGRRRSHRGRTSQPWTRVGWIRLQRRLWPPSEDHQRRGDAGAGKLQERPAAVPRSRHRPWRRARSRRRCHSPGAGSSAIQERHVRGLPRRTGVEATGQEEMAEACRVHGGAADATPCSQTTWSSAEATPRN